MERHCFLCPTLFVFIFFRCFLEKFEYAVGMWVHTLVSYFRRPIGSISFWICCIWVTNYCVFHVEAICCPTVYMRSRLQARLPQEESDAWVRAGCCQAGFFTLRAFNIDFRRGGEQLERDERGKKTDWWFKKALNMLDVPSVWDD